MNKKTKNKKRDLYISKNTRLIYANSPEGNMLCDIAIATDELFAQIRKEKDIEEINKIVKNFQKTLIKISNILEIIGENTGIEYKKPLSISLLEKEFN